MRQLVITALLVSLGACSGAQRPQQRILVLPMHSVGVAPRAARAVNEGLAVAPELAMDGLRAEENTNHGANSEDGVGSLCELPFHEARNRWQERFEREYLATQLSRAGGVVAHAAERCNLPRQTFHRLLRRHNLR